MRLSGVTRPRVGVSLELDPSSLAQCCRFNDATFFSSLQYLIVCYFQACWFALCLSTTAAMMASFVEGSSARQSLSRLFIHPAFLCNRERAAALRRQPPTLLLAICKRTDSKKNKLLLPSEADGCLIILKVKGLGGDRREWLWLSIEQLELTRLVQC